MHVHYTALAAALIACTVPAVSSASVTLTSSYLPSSGVVSGAADVGTDVFSSNPSYVPLVDTTSTPGATAQITGAGYTAYARTDFGANHAYASATAFPTEVLGAGSFSGWYDQVTITGGTGTGTAHFSVRLTGTVDVGAFIGGAIYTLGSSSVHPSQLVDSSNIIDYTPLATDPWGIHSPFGTTGLTTISTYQLAASPYNDPSVVSGLFSSSPDLGVPSSPLGVELGGDMGFPPPDLILTPGAGQVVDVTLEGTLEFTYGEAFYLIGGLGTTVIGDVLTSFCSFEIGCTEPPKDGTGTTTLDFANSAHLVGIVLPAGASASFDSGTAYNVTAVPEPGEWAMLLAGLGLVGWRARRRQSGAAA